MKTTWTPRRHTFQHAALPCLSTFSGNEVSLTTNVCTVCYSLPAVTCIHNAGNYFWVPSAHLSSKRRCPIYQILMRYLLVSCPLMSFIYTVFMHQSFWVSTDEARGEYFHAGLLLLTADISLPSTQPLQSFHQRCTFIAWGCDILVPSMYQRKCKPVCF